MTDESSNGLSVPSINSTMNPNFDGIAIEPVFIYENFHFRRLANENTD